MVGFRALFALRQNSTNRERKISRASCQGFLNREIRLKTTEIGRRNARQIFGDPALSVDIQINTIFSREEICQPMARKKLSGFVVGRQISGDFDREKSLNLRANPLSGNLSADQKSGARNYTHGFFRSQKTNTHGLASGFALFGALLIFPNFPVKSREKNLPA